MIQWGQNETAGNASVDGTIPVLMADGSQKYILLSDSPAS
jgi:hypothetical protein